MLYEDLLLHELIEVDHLASLQRVGKCGLDYLYPKWAKLRLQGKYGSSPSDSGFFNIIFLCKLFDSIRTIGIKNHIIEHQNFF